ncbi:hypothetical protein [Gemmatimonas sp.]|uniref:hypothetical protein n=1 Tax=Gemmatimonas sp. TaxID=1962908 RepID=UPI0039833DCE
MSPFSSARFLPLAVALLGAAALGACSSITESNTTLSNYGAITITGKNAAASRAAATINAVFFQGLSATAPNSALQQGDQCAYALIDSTTGGATGSLKAGESLALTFAGKSVVMPYSTALLRYEPALGTALTYTAGDTATVSVPGLSGSFPAASISVKLAEPIIPGPLVFPATGLPLDVTWNATNDVTAAIILSVRYGATATATAQNEQIYCALKDDGAYQVPASALGAFLASPSALRSVSLVRWRTKELRPDASSLVHIVSTVDTIIRFP